MSVIEPVHVMLNDGTPAIIRSSEPADADRLTAHLADNAATAPEFAVTLPHERTLTTEKQLARIAEYREDVGALELVAMVRPEELPMTEGLIGELSFKARDRQRMRHHGHFGISVHSAFRDRGVGRLLVAELLRWAERHPFIEKVCLGVFATNPRAIHLYRSMGFVEDGRRLGEFRFEDGTYVDDIQMSRWVKPPPAPTPAPAQVRDRPRTEPTP